MSWLLKSSIGRKFIMALSGCCMVLFLLFHMSMNLVLVFSTDAYNMICEFLGSNWYAVIGTMGLAALFIVHIIYAIVLTLQNRKARGADKYASSSLTDAAWSSKNMFVLGVVIILFMVLHLFQFWYKMQFAELMHWDNAVAHGSILVFELFKNPVYVIIYLVALIALWLHLSHGVWSMFQTTGLNGRTWSPRIKAIAHIFATIIVIGFAAVPVLVYAKSLMGAI